MSAVVEARVFCTEEGSGNPLGIVYTERPARALPREECLRLAAASGYPETIFASVAEWERKHLVAARVFTPGTELSFAGHPLVGLAAHYSSTHNLREPWKIRVAAAEVFAWSEGDLGWIRVAPPPLAPGPKDIFPVLKMLRADALDISPRMPVARAGYGNPYLMVAFADPERLLEIEPDLGALAESAETRDGVYCFAIRGAEVTARFFAPALGIDEDSGTGSAAVALAAFLSRHWRLAPRDFSVIQGHRTANLCKILVRRPESGIEIGGRVAVGPEREI